MARLPQPGGDTGNWGVILNDFLTQSHQADGTLRTGVVAAAQIQDGVISETKLDAAAQAKLNSGGTAGVISVNARSGAVTLTKADVGLSNVDNTSDTNKPISTATQAALNAKADNSALTSGLANKANVTHSHASADINDASTIGRAILTAADAVAVRTAIGAGMSNLQLGSTSTTAKAGDYVPTKADVGLSNVDNTSDVNKPISSAVQTALDGKQATGSYATTNDLSTGLAAKANTSHTHTAASITDFTETTQDIMGAAIVGGTNVTVNYDDTVGTVTIAAAGGASATNLSATRTANNVTIASSTGTSAVIAAADGTNAGILTAADKAKLDGIMTGAQVNTVTSVASKTGAVTLVKADVGLSNVDNTSDANKPISTATQTALDAKQVAGSYATSSDLTTGLAGKANSSHTHTTSQISDATTTGRAVLVATDAAAARSAIGAGTSNLQLGTTSSTAKAGDYVPTKADVGLSNVDNTSDANKPISTATQAALNAKADTSAIGAKVLLIDNAGALPAGTPAGVIVVVKA